MPPPSHKRGDEVEGMTVITRGGGPGYTVGGRFQHILVGGPSPAGVIYYLDDAGVHYVWQDHFTSPIPATYFSARPVYPPGFVPP